MNMLSKEQFIHYEISHSDFLCSFIFEFSVSYYLNVTVPRDLKWTTIVTFPRCLSTKFARSLSSWQVLIGEKGVSFMEL